MTTHLSNVTSSDPQSAEVSSNVAISILAKDDFDAPVAGYQVQLTCPNDPGNPGAVSASYNATTNGSGIATLIVRTNTITGTWSGTAYGFVSPYTSCTAGVTNTPSTQPATPSKLVITAGNNQSVDPSGTAAIPFEVAVYDQYNAIWTGGASVTFTAPSSGASGTFAATGTRTQAVVSNGSGAATASAFTVNSTVASFYVAVSASGCPTVNIPVTIRYAAEVCTPEVVPAGTYSTTWANPQNWISDALNYANILVAPGQTTPSIDDAFDFSAPLAGIDPQSRVTSITVTHYIYYGRTGTLGPSKFNTELQVGGLGTIGASKTNNKTAENTRTKYTNAWTAFQNTGNPGNELFIGQLQGTGGSSFVVRGTYPANEAGDVSGDMRISQMRVVVCYLPPGTPADELSVPLHYCEA